MADSNSKLLLNTCLNATLPSYWHFLIVAKNGKYISVAGEHRRKKKKRHQSFRFVSCTGLRMSAAYPTETLLASTATKRLSAMHLCITACVRMYRQSILTACCLFVLLIYSWLLEEFLCQLYCNYLISAPSITQTNADALNACWWQKRSWICVAFC